jgi:hypothetical protein
VKNRQERKRARHVSIVADRQNTWDVPLPALNGRVKGFPAQNLKTEVGMKELPDLGFGGVSMQFLRHRWTRREGRGCSRKSK